MRSDAKALVGCDHGGVKNRGKRREVVQQLAVDSIDLVPTPLPSGGEVVRQRDVPVVNEGVTYRGQEATVQNIMHRGAVEDQEAEAGSKSPPVSLLR